MTPLVVNDTLTIPVTDLSWEALRASGPGGQNVNKVSSKVALRFDLPRCAVLDDDVKARLAHLARNRLDAEGRVVVTSQRTRDQSRNLDDAMARLRALVLAALVPPVPRKATAPSRAVRARRLADKRHNADRKRLRERPARDE